MTETQYSIASDNLNSSTTPKDDDKLKFSTLSSISSSPFNTISTTASDKTLADESLVPKDLLDSVFSTFGDNSVGDIDLSLNVSRSSLSGNTIVEKHNSVSTKHNSASTNTNSINKKHNSGLSKINYESNNKEESKVTQGPRKDFRTPTSSFLLDDRFNSADLENLNLEASEANIQVPITFSAVSLNLDIGDFATKTQNPITTSPSSPTSPPSSPPPTSPPPKSPPPTSPPPKSPPPASIREIRDDKINNENRGSKIFRKERSGCGCAIM